ncbi:MAG: hypothetical protein M3P06_13320 [Acidobacteriota bacterium]|nr:hypothetical protein [Acidobacteriota bacterium]
MTGVTRTPLLSGVCLFKKEETSTLYARSLSAAAASSDRLGDFTPAGSRYIDLFHYPLTYGQACPGLFYRRRDAETAFAETFLEKNRLSRAVRDYLEIYCTRTGTSRPRMAAAFRELLVSNATPAGMPHPGVRHLPWTRFLTMLDEAKERSSRNSRRGPSPQGAVSLAADRASAV